MVSGFAILGTLPSGACLNVAWSNMAVSPILNEAAWLACSGSLWCVSIERDLSGIPDL